MGIFDWFRRPPPIADGSALIDYLDTRAAYLIQRGIFEFAHACTGLAFNKLMQDAAFVEAIDKSRWASYPLGLSTVSEMIHGVLRTEANGAMPLAEALQGAAFEAFDRYPVPVLLGAEAWATERADLGQRVIGIALHPPKAVKDIPLAVVPKFSERLPIHEQIRGDDQEIITNHLRMILIRLYDDFVQRADTAALVAELGVARAVGGTKAARG